MLNKPITTLLGVILTCLTICTISAYPGIMRPKLNSTVPIDTVQTISRNDSIYDSLVQKTNQYIKSRFPKSKLTGKALVEACTKRDFDICFALAQAEIESGLGTAGKAKRTNSPWNVGAYDGRSAQTMNKLGFGYSHPDQSIEPYIELVQTKYLGNRRTIHDLMKRYVTLSGSRYATDPNYELTLKATYQRICTTTTLRGLQQQLES